MVYDINKQGRIHKDAFIVTTALFYGFAVLAVLLRFLIQHHTRRSFSLVDFFLLIAVSALTAAFGILFGHELKYTYPFTALTSGTPNTTHSNNIIPIAFERFKFVNVALWLCWTATLASKFSFVFFFRKLIEKIWGLNVYWWIVLAYNVLAGGYGYSVYYLSCPYFYDARSFTCDQGAGKDRVIAFTASHVALDVLGDILILAIPVAIIWNIKVSLAQKIALTLSLCLTGIMVIITIIRVSGIKYNGIVDQVWQFYWSVISAEVAVFMAGAISFRSFFVARNSSRASSPPPMRSMKLFRDSFIKRFDKKRESGSNEFESAMVGLPYMPKAHLTGMRTFIDGSGKSFLTSSLSVDGTFEEQSYTASLEPGPSKSGWREFR